MIVQNEQRNGLKPFNGQRLVMDDYRLSRPPLVPSEDEQVVSDCISFESECRAYVADHAKDLGWTFGNSLTTRSKKFGLVFRIDFEASPVGPDWVSRLVFWREPGTDVISGLDAYHGQRGIDPL
jgi:hypothetical protein